MTAKWVIEQLQIYVIEAGSQRAFAKKIGVSPSYLNDVVLGRRDPGQKILNAIGVERVVTYQKMGTIDSDGAKKNERTKTGLQSTRGTRFTARNE